MEVKFDPFPVFLSIKQAAGVICFTPRILHLWIEKNDGPPVHEFGGGKHKRFRIRKDELLEWIESKKRNPQYVQSLGRAARKSHRVDVDVQGKANGRNGVRKISP